MIRSHRLAAAAAMALAFTPACATAGTLAFAPAPTIANAQARRAETVPLLVNGNWLARHLADARQVIIHAASSRPEYEAGHVPGARLLPFSTYAPTIEGLSSQLAPVAQLDSALEAIGVNDGDRLVIYGQPIQVARLLVTLDYLGLKGRVSVLDGGIDAWRDAGHTISREAPTVARGSFTPNVDASVIADIGWVSQNTNASGVRILDARAPEFYLGYSAGQMPRAGHIPGAANIPFSQLTGDADPTPRRAQAEPPLCGCRGEEGRHGRHVLPHRNAGLAAVLRRAPAGLQRAHLRRIVRGVEQEDRVAGGGGDGEEALAVQSECGTAPQCAVLHSRLPSTVGTGTTTSRRTHPPCGANRGT